MSGAGDFAALRRLTTKNTSHGCNRLGRVRRQLERRLAEVFAEHGLTAADFEVLVNCAGPGRRTACHKLA
jgi:hypothetical protein